MFERFVAIGDSFAEGVGDDNPASPNGVLGWADRVAHELGRTRPDLRYANLAIRGRRIRPIVEEQLGPAIALEPDLVAISGGGNDILWPMADIDAVAAELDAAVGTLTASGARVVVFTLFGSASTPVFRQLRGRFALFNEHLREIADRHDAALVDQWRMRVLNTPGMWADDRLHLSPTGHVHLAAAVLDALAEPHTLRIPEPPARRPDHPGAEPAERSSNTRGHLRWTADHLLPWIGRRVLGISHGDRISAKYPDYVDARSLPLPACA